MIRGRITMYTFVYKLRVRTDIHQIIIIYNSRSLATAGHGKLHRTNDGFKVSRVPTVCIYNATHYNMVVRDGRAA